MKQIAIFICLVFLIAPLSGCFGASEDDVSNDSTVGNDASSNEGTTDGSSENQSSESESPNSETTEPESSPYDVICPDGSNESIQWGVPTCAEPTVFKASDVSNETLNLTLEWYRIATQEWGNFGPVEIFIIGEDVEAAKELEDIFCERHKALDEKWNEEWDCANENYQIFSHYPEEGGAAISTFKRTYIDYDFMVMIMSAKYPGPDEQDYKPVTLHEYFHIFQHSHISDECTADSRDVCQRDAKMGGEGKPWFSEGGAVYMAQSLYAKQDGVPEDYLREAMQRKLDMSHEGYNAQNESLDQLGYDAEVNVYDVGCWFIAYLLHHEGVDAFLNGFYGDLDNLGFDAAFEANFNGTRSEYIADFDAFFSQPAEDVMLLFPEASSNNNETTD